MESQPKNPEHGIILKTYTHEMCESQWQEKLPTNKLMALILTDNALAHKKYIQMYVFHISHTYLIYNTSLNTEFGG